MMALRVHQIVLGCVACVAAVLAQPTQIETPAERTPAVPRPYIGVRVTDQVPDLLRMHLQIPDQQGLVVENVFRNSPADKAGLDKGDILLEMDGQALTSAGEFYRRLRQLPVGTRLTLSLIRKGKKLSQTVILEPMADDFRSNRVDWKYPLEPQESIALRPARLFRLPPGQSRWIEIPLQQLQQQTNAPITLNPEYHFLHQDGQDSFTVIFEGDPHQPQTIVRVKANSKEYFSTVEHIAALPSEFAAAAQWDLQKAQRAAQQSSALRLPMQLDFSALRQAARQISGKELQDPVIQPIEILLKRLEELERRQIELENALRAATAAPTDR